MSRDGLIAVKKVVGDLRAVGGRSPSGIWEKLLGSWRVVLGRDRQGGCRRWPGVIG